MSTEIPDWGDNVRELVIEATIGLQDFVAYMPMHSYIFAPSGERWPGSSVNARITLSKGKASDWLDVHNPVEQMTWAPGSPQIIEGRLVSNGGWIERPGCRCFNLYRPPMIGGGNPNDADPWLEH